MRLKFGNVVGHFILCRTISKDEETMFVSLSPVFFPDDDVGQFLTILFWAF